MSSQCAVPGRPRLTVAVATLSEKLVKAGPGTDKLILSGIEPTNKGGYMVYWTGLTAWAGNLNIFLSDVQLSGSSFDVNMLSEYSLRLNIPREIANKVDQHEPTTSQPKQPTVSPITTLILWLRLLAVIYLLAITVFAFVNAIQSYYENHNTNGADFFDSGKTVIQSSPFGRVIGFFTNFLHGIWDNGSYIPKMIYNYIWPSTTKKEYYARI